MILRKSALLSILLSARPGAAYFAQVNNAHVEFVATAASSGAVVNAESGSLTLSEELERALGKVSQLGFKSPKIVGLFEEWAGRFEREYESLEEKGKRILVWLENHVLIETHNAEESSFTLGHNEFSDMTHAEFRERMRLGEFAPALVRREGKEFKFLAFDEEATSGSHLRGANDAAVAEEQRELRGSADDADGEDWHGKGFMGPVRNQGSCGACWAFSAVGSIEAAMAIDKFNAMTPSDRGGLVGADLGLVIPLSEQDLIDCDTSKEKGCDGGLMITSFEEEEVRKGICSETDYPYMAKQGTCTTDLCAPVPGSIVKDHWDVNPRMNNALKEALKTKPVTAAMVGTDVKFKFYQSGVFSSKTCGRPTKKLSDKKCELVYDGQEVCFPDVDHGVLVVGYGKDEYVTTGTKGFFKVKNSWGPGWGENGYFRLARPETDKTDPMENWGTCAILSLLSFPEME